MRMKTMSRRLTAFLLSVFMLLTCMPMGVLAEGEITDTVTVEVIPEAEETAPAAETEAAGAETVTEETPSPQTDSTPQEETADEPLDETTEEHEAEQVQTKAPAEPAQAPDEGHESESTEAAVTDASETALSPETMEPAAEAPAEVSPATTDPSTPTESDAEMPAEAPEAETASELEPTDHRTPLQAAIEDHGHIYAATYGQTEIFGTASLKADSLIYTTTRDIFLVLATSYTEQDTVKVWFLDENGTVVSGYVAASGLNDNYLLDEDIGEINYLPAGSGMTDIGKMTLFTVNGSYPASPAEEPAVEAQPQEPEDESAFAEETEPPVDNASDADDTEGQDTVSEEPEGNEAGEPLDEPVIEPVEEEPVVMPVEESIYPAEGAYVGVTTDTRVFAEIDADAAQTTYSGQYLGHFVKDAVVQILSADFDENGGVWYQVRFLYGDDFADGRMKWTDYSTAWIMADETGAATGDSCTVTDFAYTLEYLRMTRTSGGRKKLMAATPMNGFSLKNINGAVGGFYAWQQNLYGSSGKDSAYPQLAKSAAHGLIYATPHYLEGFTVFCLEHNLSGPGEGSGSSQSAKGPYVLVDMDTFVTNSSYGGTTGVRYKASTMHALGWVLRHTYPFMALNRSDANNETWSRVAGQFAMREVIKQLEGAQYVRSYWDMDNFYSFSGGAPAVYLEYARWLATNGIAHASITGNITASNKSLSVSGSNYVGTVTLTTDADLIRIPKSVGTLNGNSGGSDTSYYYVKSGDTIQMTSTQNKFAISMESISSADEEANFLVGVPSVAIQKIMVPLYGTPYPLKSASVTFELSYGTIQVTKKSSDGILLKGTVFELLNGAGTVVAMATTGANGVASFASLQPGTYTVREKTPSQGYKLAATTTQSVSVVAGVNSTATFTNTRIQGKVRIVKTDSVTNKPLPGAVFSVTRLSGPESDNASDIGKVVATLTTNSQGVAETGLLPWGEYRITETGVPDDYIDAGFTTTVWIK